MDHEEYNYFCDDEETACELSLCSAVSMLMVLLCSEVLCAVKKVTDKLVKKHKNNK